MTVYIFVLHYPWAVVMSLEVWKYSFNNTVVQTLLSYIIQYPVIKRGVGVSLTGLTLPHLCAWPKLGFGFPTSYVLVFSCSVRWKWEVIVRFVDIDDHHCFKLSCQNCPSNDNIERSSILTTNTEPSGDTISQTIVFIFVLFL